MPTPYSQFQQPNSPANVKITLSIKKDEVITYLNDNNPNGADGSSYILINNQGTAGYMTPTMPAVNTPLSGDNWMINQVTAAHDMTIELAPTTTSYYVLDNMYNVYLQIN